MSTRLLKKEDKSCFKDDGMCLVAMYNLSDVVEVLTAYVVRVESRLFSTTLYGKLEVS